MGPGVRQDSDNGRLPIFHRGPGIWPASQRSLPSSLEVAGYASETEQILSKGLDQHAASFEASLREAPQDEEFP